MRKPARPLRLPPLGMQIIASVRESCVGVLEVADAAFFVAIKMIQLIGAEQKFSLIFRKICGIVSIKEKRVASIMKDS